MINHIGNTDQPISPPCGRCSAACCKSGQFGKIGLNHAEKSKFKTDGKGDLAKKPNGDCHYLENNQCSIQAGKPKTCIQFDCRVFDAFGIVPVELNANDKPAPIRGVDNETPDEFSARLTHQKIMREVTSKLLAENGGKMLTMGCWDGVQTIVTRYARIYKRDQAGIRFMADLSDDKKRMLMQMEKMAMNMTSSTKP